MSGEPGSSGDETTRGAYPIEKIEKPLRRKNDA
jgi:hypothetical protein